MPVFTSSIEVTADYPTIKPSLNLNFARARALDPRITFTRASVGTYVGRDGLIKTAGNNEARFDHDPDTLESLGLLLEESRTNIALYSQEFNNGYWSKTGGGNPGTTVTANQEIAPDGTTTADYIDYTTATAASQNVERSYDNNPDGKIYTGSVWIKGTAGQTFNLTLDANGVSGSAQQFTLNGDWQRFSITRTYPAGSPAALFRFGVRSLGHPSTGTATQVYAWGAQIELGSFATSYIPTSGSSVTRSSETAKVDEQIASGDITICAEYKLRLTASNQWNRLFGFGEGSSDIRPLVNGSGQINFFNYSTEFTVPWPVSQPDFDTPFKFAMAVRQNVANSVVIDGGSVNTQSNTNPGAFVNWNELYLGWAETGNNPRNMTGTIKEFRVYNDSLTDAQLQLLTS